VDSDETACLRSRGAPCRAVVMGERLNAETTTSETEMEDAIHCLSRCHSSILFSQIRVGSTFGSLAAGELLQKNTGMLTFELPSSSTGSRNKGKRREEISIPGPTQGPTPKTRDRPRKRGTDPENTTPKTKAADSPMRPACSQSYFRLGRVPSQCQNTACSAFSGATRAQKTSCNEHDPR